MDYYSNYQEDLIKSIKSPLLIELNKNDLINFCKDSSVSGLDIAFLTAKEIYNHHLNQDTRTNVLYIDSDKKTGKTNSILLEQIINQIDDSLLDKEATSQSLPLLRTVRATFTAYGSSINN